MMPQISSWHFSELSKLDWMRVRVRRQWPIRYPPGMFPPQEVNWSHNNFPRRVITATFIWLAKCAPIFGTVVHPSHCISTVRLNADSKDCPHAEVSWSLVVCNWGDGDGCGDFVSSCHVWSFPPDFCVFCKSVCVHINMCAAKGVCVCSGWLGGWTVARIFNALRLYFQICIVFSVFGLFSKRLKHGKTMQLVPHNCECVLFFCHFLYFFLSSDFPRRKTAICKQSLFLPEKINNP